MAYSFVSKLLGLVLISAAQMVSNVSNPVEITGITGSNITLQFTFGPNVNLIESSHLIIHENTTGQKIAEYEQGNEENVLDVHPKNSSVFWHITNLKLKHTGNYYASLVSDLEPAKKSSEVQLVVQETKGSNTVPPLQRKIPVIEDSKTSFHMVTITVVSPLMLLAAVLPFLIWFLVRNKDKQQQPQQQISNPIVQETENVSSPTLVYSVLDFPKRTQVVLENNPRDTEYAAVSYLK
ncbi:uncharacterized protein [Antennarius striatus]|uniref:uncharacterized protein isoform X1 n=1 Tax=Antennarius striatus TaxID=241820 RepID=UPI0035AE9B83